MESLSHYLQVRQKDRRVVFDEKTILTTVSRCIRDQFGSQGEVNIQVVSWKSGVVVVEIKKSIWAHEFFEQREQFLQCCNTFFDPEHPIQKIFVRT